MFKEQTVPLPTVSSADRTDLEAVLNAYILRDYQAVHSLLKSNPFLAPILMEAIPVIKSYFGSTAQTVLEVIRDPEGGENGTELFALIQTTDWPQEAVKKLDRLDQEWWIDASTQAHCRLSPPSKAWISRIALRRFQVSERASDAKSSLARILLRLSKAASALKQNGTA